MRDELSGVQAEFTPLGAAADAPAVLQRIAAAGIVGMGGAGYPTATKIREARAGDADIVIGNGMASEPDASADRTLLHDHADAVVAGLEVVARCLGGARPILAVPLGSGLEAPAVELLAGPDGGEERRLVERLTGRRVPRSAYPTDVGVLVLNVATLFAVFEAVAHGRAPRRRIVTVAGTDAWVTIGTPLADLPLPAGGRPLRIGGALTGRPAPPDALVEATTFSVAPAPPPALPCIRCGHCAGACPAALLPDKLHTAFENGGADPSAWNCIECGACTAACPSGIDLVNEIRELTRRMGEDAARRQAADAARRRWTARMQRLARQTEHRDAKRAARLREPRKW